jgi:hypothetical protein
MAGLGVVRFKFKSSIKVDTVSFEGHYVQIAELKRLIADKRGVPAEALEISEPKSKPVRVYADDEQLPRNSTVDVRRVHTQQQPARGGGLRGAGAAALADLPIAGGAALPAPLGADDFGPDLFSAGPIAAGEEQAVAAALGGEAAQWEEGRDRNIARQMQHRAAMAARGGGAGGRGGGRGPVPDFFWCTHCGAQNQHLSADCPMKHNPNKPDLKHVRAPAGIPLTLLSQTQEGALLLPSGQVGALRVQEDQFQRVVQALPTAAGQRRSPLALPAADGGGGEPLALPAPGAASQQQQPRQQQPPPQQPAPAVQQTAINGMSAGAGRVGADAAAGGMLGGGLFDEGDAAPEGDLSNLQLGLGMAMGLPGPPQDPQQQQAVVQQGGQQPVKQEQQAEQGGVSGLGGGGSDVAALSPVHAPPSSPGQHALVGLRRQQSSRG